MTNLFNPLDYPTGLMRPVRSSPSAWAEHVPFAFSVVEMLRPRTVVELGVYAGVSYCALCQAIDHFGLASQAYGVDTWQGDPHSGFNGPEVLQDLRAHHDPRYGRFSRLIPATFDEALEHFADGSIDLLHIDGYHTYEAVRRDFESWLPKMSAAGVMLFHDVNVHERGFGVWRLWGELKGRYRSFEFTHQHGLGVLAVGPNCPEALAPLLEAGEAEAARIRDYYFQLGQRITRTVQHQRAEQTAATRLAEVNGDCQRRLADGDRRLAEAKKLLEVCEDKLHRAREAAERASSELDAIRRSLSFRCANLVARFGRALAPAGSGRRRVLNFARRRGRSLVRG
jgi:O-antigen biosynthesis protein